MSEYFKHTPAVFAVDKYYQIMMLCEKSCLFFVKVALIEKVKILLTKEIYSAIICL